MQLRELIVHVPCKECSFYYFFENVKQRFKHHKLTHSIITPTYFNITDAKLFLEAISCIFKDKPMILWLDTPYLVESGCTLKKAKVYVTSEYVKKLVGHITNVDGILRPPYNLIAEYERRIPVEKKHMFIVVGAEPKKRKIIRKRIEYTLNILQKMGLRKNTKVISNVGDYDIPIFTLNTSDLYSLLHRSYFYISLSKSEGFGMPLMEAMSVGTPAVFINAYSYKEFAVGIPIDPYDVIIEENKPWKMENYIVKENDVREAINEAKECVMRKSCYEDLSIKALERSKEFSQYNLEETLIKELKYVMSNNKK